MPSIYHEPLREILSRSVCPLSMKQIEERLRASYGIEVDGVYNPLKKLVANGEVVEIEVNGNKAWVQGTLTNHCAAKWMAMAQRLEAFIEAIEQRSKSN